MQKSRYAVVRVLEVAGWEVSPSGGSSGNHRDGKVLSGSRALTSWGHPGWPGSSPPLLLMKKSSSGENREFGVW